MRGRVRVGPDMDKKPLQDRKGTESIFKERSHTIKIVKQGMRSGSRRVHLELNLNDLKEP